MLRRPNDALIAFEKCCQIRKQVLGETDYFTELARREIAVCQYSISMDMRAKKILKRFIDLIEGGSFVTEADTEQLQILEAKTLCILLMDLSDMSDPEEYKYYLKIYDAFARNTNTWASQQ